MLSEQSIVLNLVPGEVSPLVHAIQNDVGREITLNLINGDAPFTLSSSYSYSLTGTKASGSGFLYDPSYNACDLQVTGPNSLSLKTTAEMTSVEGAVRCGLIIYNGTQRIETQDFILLVHRCCF